MDGARRASTECEHAGSRTPEVISF